MLSILWFWRIGTSLWRALHSSQIVSMHVLHQYLAGTLFSFRSQNLHNWLSVSFVRSNVLTISLFWGRKDAHSSSVMSFLGASMRFRHTGQLIVFVFKLSWHVAVLDIHVYVWIHDSQKVWRHDRYFGFLTSSRHIGQRNVSSDELVVRGSFPEAAIVEKDFRTTFDLESMERHNYLWIRW